MSCSKPAMNQLQESAFRKPYWTSREQDIRRDQSYFRKHSFTASSVYNSNDDQGNPRSMASLLEAMGSSIILCNDSRSSHSCPKAPVANLPFSQVRSGQAACMVSNGDCCTFKCMVLMALRINLCCLAADALMDCQVVKAEASCRSTAEQCSLATLLSITRLCCASSAQCDHALYAWLCCSRCPAACAGQKVLCQQNAS